MDVLTFTNRDLISGVHALSTGIQFFPPTGVQKFPLDQLIFA